MVRQRSTPAKAGSPRRRVIRASAALWLILAAVLAWLVIELHALNTLRATNAAVQRGHVADLAVRDSPRGRLARAYAAQLNDELDKALDAYAKVGDGGDPRLREVLRFNLANLFLARAAEFERRGERQLSISLIEQAKQNYRELLARNPGHWDARYNLSRALEMLPDLADVHYGEEMNPERSPQAPQADTAHDRLP